MDPLDVEKRLGLALGLNVRRQRHELGLTQEDLAFLVETSPNYLSRLEGGRSNCTFRTLSRLAVALKCDPLALLVDRGEISSHSAGPLEPELHGSRRRS